MIRVLTSTETMNEYGAIGYNRFLLSEPFNSSADIKNCVDFFQLNKLKFIF